jgi:hypothetical protein
MSDAISIRHALQSHQQTGILGHPVVDVRFQPGDSDDLIALPGPNRTLVSLYHGGMWMHHDC